ncbi:MAG: single-stranded DNA-binding protein [Candidatus Harrisonbacteria bacterium CG10_big_fil_rev_8_21_14_0_10_38_8]|uniref:Single-stranded DNA-binding protein n=1 Tax=Candidatus Harrisonbacteria bacterium CG10_big_fil_rev_8_21_14_0_10_38_8 TaxID=1974582 RepID=A0A2M6WJS4_9BACT|nr:MAG: single-stranded DNA-binding protein [Candidatus Harrisonbacteria bacterium CG10_big_fil_rev_8_21_14_0_10_38_8]
MNLNKVLLIGRLTSDPQLRSTNSNQSVASFSLAINRFWTKDGEKKEDTEFVNIVVWGRQAEVSSKFLTKGQIAFVEGRIQSRDYEDKEGNKRRVTEVVADRVQFGPRPGGSSQGVSESAEDTAKAVEDIPTINIDEEINSEDLPF